MSRNQYSTVAIDPERAAFSDGWITATKVRKSYGF